jgi:NAD(P)-dependent dehydrogenase (short-subunit alcohol dehydrogenase family)
MRLKDKVAIVTGGGNGIGREIARTFALEGASVVVVGRTLAQLEQTVAEIRSRNGEALAIQADVADESQVERMVASTLEQYGHIDVLVNNSAITGPTANVVDMRLDAWNEVLAINLTGAMLCSREVLKQMIPRKSGAIIMMTSEGGRGGDGRAGYPRRSPYCCSKIAMIGLAETMAVEVGEYGIRVNAISPAGVRGERISRLMAERARSMGISPEELIARHVSNYSLGRMAEESEIASVALFLASSESSAITGQTIVANCGQHIVH